MDGARVTAVAEFRQPHRRDDVGDDRFSNTAVCHDHRCDECATVVGWVAIRAYNGKSFTDQSGFDRWCRTDLYCSNVCYSGSVVDRIYKIFQDLHVYPEKSCKSCLQLLLPAAAERFVELNQRQQLV